MIKHCECNWEECNERAPEGSPDWGSVCNENTGNEDIYLCPEHRAQAVV